MEYQLITPHVPLSTNLTVIERVLTNRGINFIDIPHYLNTTNEDILDPLLLENIENGIKMLIQCVSNNETLFLQVDSDCDGYTSAAIFLNYLYKLFPFYTKNHVIYRLHEGKEHGLIPETIPEEAKLVVALDSSSNDYQEHEFLHQTLKKNILVLDHHEAEKISENACIINNQLCKYPTKSLSGAGIVYKFCSQIDKIMNTNYANDLLDLVALGMIADMVSTKDFETKHLINLGLKAIYNPFFSTMVEKNSFSLGDEITPIGVAFYIAPYVNATIRMGTYEEKNLLFKSMIEHEAYDLIPSTKRGHKGEMETIVEQACRNCTNIKNRQGKARDNTLEIIERIIKEKKLLDNKILVIQLDSNLSVDKNLTGLIANQLMAKYQRPVLLLNKVVKTKTFLDENYKSIAQEEISWEGSGRGYDKSSLKNFKEFLESSCPVMYAEGHASAFGVGILDYEFDNFINTSNALLENFEFIPSYKVDFIFDESNFKSSDIIEIANLKYLWGQGVEEPYIAIENIKISNENIILMSPDKNPTLKIILPNGVSLIKFKSSQEELDKLKNNNGYTVIAAVGRCEKNVWNGVTSAQILIEDYDVTDTIKYYF